MPDIAPSPPPAVPALPPVSSPASSPVPPPLLSPLAERFVLHWGEMGSRWGVNRTVSQIHALLFYLGTPMVADDIAAALTARIRPHREPAARSRV